jgi:hypothetical protein
LTVICPAWYLLALGTWAMLHEPVHFAVFIIICLLLPLLLYVSFILLGFYVYLKEAYIEVGYRSLTLDTRH